MFVQSNIENMNLKTFFTSLQRSNEREDYSSTKEYLLLKVFCSLGSHRHSYIQENVY
jgi:hypothetical protein